MKCWECEINESDNKPRQWKEVATGKIYSGTRNFCSDKCESDYCEKMTQKHPEFKTDFIRFDNVV